jgi:hypothetical protein
MKILSGFGPRETEPGACAGRIAGFLQNALVLQAGNPGRSAMTGRQITFSVNSAAYLRRLHCSLIIRSGTNKPNDKN